MSYIIPETPSAVSTQLAREKVLAQEAKYEKGVKGREDEDEILSVLRDAGALGSRPGGRRGSWARRFSKISDSLDAHIDVERIASSQQRVSDASTVWQAP